MTPGCTDPTAVNYDPLATIDDGSCTYCNVFSVLPDTLINVIAYLLFSVLVVIAIYGVQERQPQNIVVNIGELSL